MCILNEKMHLQLTYILMGEIKKKTFSFEKFFWAQVIKPAGVLM